MGKRKAPHCFLAANPDDPRKPLVICDRCGHVETLDLGDKGMTAREILGAAILFETQHKCGKEAPHV